MKAAEYEDNWKQSLNFFFLLLYIVEYYRWIVLTEENFCYTASISVGCLLLRLSPFPSKILSLKFQKIVVTSFSFREIIFSVVQNHNVDQE
jgi:hypothetical protein